MKKIVLFSVLLVSLTTCTLPPLGWYAPQSGATTLDNLLLVLWASHKSLNVNQPITIRFTVTNEGRETVIYDRRDKPVIDIYIPGGIPKVKWSDGKPSTLELTRLELKPGESKTIEMTWSPGKEFDQKVISIDGYVWWCAEDKPCFNQVGVGISVGFVQSALP